MIRRKKNEGKRSPEQRATTCSVMGCPFCVKIEIFRSKPSEIKRTVWGDP